MKNLPNIPSGNSLFSMLGFRLAQSRPQVIIEGIQNSVAVSGDHLSISMSVSEGTIDVRKWGSTYRGSEYGTGINPTDFSAGVGGRLYATATVDGIDYTRSVIIVSASNWILLDGTWNDTRIWEDTSNWKDVA